MNEIQKHNFRILDTKVPPELHKTPEAQKLKEACQQFESILWAQIWKKMRNSARQIGGSEEARPWKQMEDLSLEMATDSLAASSAGPGLWKLLYDQVAVGLAMESASVQNKGEPASSGSEESGPVARGNGKRS